MATGINMSLYGLYTYDETVLDTIYVPAFINKDILIQNILLECAEMTILYTDPKFLKMAIGYWSRARAHVWERMAVVLYEDYDPFVNIKRDEVRTITQQRDLHTNATSQNYGNAWNSGPNVERDSTEGNGNESGTVTTTENFHVEGDSAITDAQDVAKKEVELRDEYDLYKYIVNDFKNRFCLHIY